VRITWIEALCVLTIAIATLHLPAAGRGDDAPAQVLPAGSKAVVVATSARLPALPRHHEGATP
jgi:hypothetical protein